MLLLPNFHAFSFRKALNHLLWCQSLTNPNNKGYRWGFMQGSRDPRPQWLVQGMVMWLNRSQWEATGMLMGVLGPRSFLCLLLLLLFWSTRSGAATLWPPGVKVPVATRKSSRMDSRRKRWGQELGRKRGGKRASCLHSLDPYFQLCPKSAVAERWDKKLFLVLNRVSVTCNQNRQKPVCLGN